MPPIFSSQQLSISAELWLVNGPMCVLTPYDKFVKNEENLPESQYKDWILKEILDSLFGLHDPIGINYVRLCRRRVFRSLNLLTAETLLVVLKNILLFDCKIKRGSRNNILNVYLVRDNEAYDIEDIYGYDHGLCRFLDSIDCRE